MATNHDLCSECKKGASASKCEKCAKIVCTVQSMDHRQQLTKQFDEMQKTRYRLQQRVDEHHSNLRMHPIIQKIGDWENESIAKIRKMAKETREHLHSLFTKNIDEAGKSLKNTYPIHIYSQDDEQHIEAKLHQFQKNLQQAMDTLNKLSSISFEEGPTPLVTGIVINQTNNKAEITNSERTTRNEDGGFARAGTTDQSPTETKPDDQTISRVSVNPVNSNVNNNVVNISRQSTGNKRSVSLPRIYEKFDDSDDDIHVIYPSYAKQDIINYRKNYPWVSQNDKATSNYEFYANKIPFFPHGDYIDAIHNTWFSDYRKLEYNHDYIQWLFPIQEEGLNYYAQALQKHEIELIKNDKTALKRIQISYLVILDFYGFKLVNESTGEISRSDGDGYKERFENLNFSSHNYLRITRILKCLGEFDYEHYKFPFLERMLQEIIIEDTLPNCLQSCKDYWIETLLDKSERRAIRKYARDLIQYRNDGRTIPESFRAVRPSPSSITRQYHREIPPKKDQT